ncbi:MAG: ferredoxin family protein [Planctomycetes bacterium]|nr:ferredoxin family protein [Planctomycetota bacterium]
MAHVVTEPCVNCKYTDCVEVCPVDCFHEAPTTLLIDPEVCIDCGLCIPECPVEAIFQDVDVPERWKHWIDLNASEAPKHPVITQKQEPLPTAPPRP